MLTHDGRSASIHEWNMETTMIDVILTQVDGAVFSKTFSCNGDALREMTALMEHGICETTDSVVVNAKNRDFDFDRWIEVLEGNFRYNLNWTPDYELN